MTGRRSSPPPGRLLAGLAALVVTAAAAHAGGGGGHGEHPARTPAAVGVLSAVIACTLAFAWPALGVAWAPERRRLTGRAVLAAAAAACTLGPPLALTRAPGAVDGHVWAMARFELLAVLGPLALASAVRATAAPARPEGRGAGLGAVVWSVSAYAWHLPPLHTLASPGAELARSFTWVTAGLLLCLPLAARRGPFLAAHLAALPLAALMVSSGRGTAGLLMAVVDAVMVACLLNGAVRKGCYTDVNIGSNPWLTGSDLRYRHRDRDRKASDARGREQTAHQDRTGHTRRRPDAPVLAARRPQ
ncbi:hypothetical protein ACYF6T_33125 [Streptomyces sp. 7R007]